MPTGKTCGNCANFTRFKDWGGERNGLCDRYDWSCHSDDAYAKRCPGYKGRRWDRRTEGAIKEQEVEE